MLPRYAHAAAAYLFDVSFILFCFALMLIARATFAAFTCRRAPMF